MRARFPDLAFLAFLALAGCASDGPPVVEDRPSPAPAAATKPEPATPAALEPFVQELPGTMLSFELRPVPGGTIDLGEGPVRVAPLWFAATETTWDFYDVFVYESDKDAAGSSGNDAADAVTRPSRPYVAPDRGYGHTGYAAISLAYRGAEAFCEWLSAKTGRRYRLPTEAEWRHACALSGIDASNCDRFAWHDGNCDYEPHPVGTKEADQLGLFDLWGNVREWCIDAEGRPVALGGSFWDLRDELGCAARWTPEKSWQVTDPQVPKSPWWLSDAPFMGMRVVCVPEDTGTNEQGDDR